MNVPLLSNLEKSYKVLKTKLNKILEKGIICDKEYRYRKNRIDEANDKNKVLGKICQEYRANMHETFAIDYISNFPGVLLVSNDHKGDAGIDFIFNNNLIECKTCTFGDITKKKKLENTGILDNKHLTKVLDYKEPFRLITERIYSSIKTKRDKYIEDVKKEVIDQSIPYIIWIDLGDLAEISFFSSGEEGAKLLNGMGNMVVKIDIESSALEKLGYEKQSDLYKDEGIIINRDIFGNLENSVISGIILTSKNSLYEDYDKTNTNLYVNYNAINQLDIRDFEGFNIWVLENDGTTYKIIANEL